MASIHADYVARTRREMTAKRRLLLAALVPLHRLFPRGYYDRYGQLVRRSDWEHHHIVRDLQKRLASLRRFRSKWPEVRAAHARWPAAAE